MSLIILKFLPKLYCPYMGCIPRDTNIVCWIRNSISLFLSSKEKYNFTKYDFWFFYSISGSSQVPFVFKNRPPKISDSFLRAISESRDETQDSSNHGTLLEFCPVYTRENCSSDKNTLFKSRESTLEDVVPDIPEDTSVLKCSSNSKESFSTAIPKAQSVSII